MKKLNVHAILTLVFCAILLITIAVSIHIYKEEYKRWKTFSGEHNCSQIENAVSTNNFLISNNYAAAYPAKDVDFTIFLTTWECDDGNTYLR